MHSPENTVVSNDSLAGDNKRTYSAAATAAAAVDPSEQSYIVSRLDDFHSQGNQTSCQAPPVAALCSFPARTAAMD